MDRSKPWSGGSDRVASGELQRDTNGENHLLHTLDQIGNFVRAFRTKLRFGELSRAPLRLLRFQLQGDMVECDWMAREPDEWDEDLPATERQLTATQQALEDSLAVRIWLFRTLPSLKSARVKVFREAGDHTPELIMVGEVTREEPEVKVLSVAMKAKLCGFQFWLNNGIMEPLSA